ncbi:MAG TPA: MFS transporter [Thermodesulfobacteriota bacterium]|nr:MFS transporter [Thermodesulfobacteriota bacterium]HNU70362.1 MFS transporter [Thermodesulfobacteriota bacterium]
MQSLPPHHSWKKTLWICFAAQLCTSMGFSCIFPFLPIYLTHLSTSSHFSITTLSGLVYSSQAFTMMIASPIWGALADRYGRKPMVVRSMIGGGITILLMGFVATAEQLIFLRALQGLLSGVLSAVSALVVSRVPRNRVGYAMGILQLGLWSGVSVGQVAGGVLSDLLGFRATFMITAALLVGTGISVWTSVDGASAPSAQRQKGPCTFWRTWKRILGSPGLTVTLVLRFYSSIGRTALSPILPLFMMSLMPGTHHIAGYTGIILGASSAASTLSALYFGRLGDRAGHRRVALYCALGTGFFYLPQTYVSAPWQLLILHTMTGVGIGGLIPSLSALLAHCSLPSDAGSVYGLDNSVNAAGRTVSPLLAASVAAWFGLRGVFAVTGLIFLAAFATITLFLRAPIARKPLPSSPDTPEIEPKSISHP